MAISSSSVDGRHSELVKRGTKIKEPKDYDDSRRDFDVADLDGNVIFCGSLISSSS
jgi:hypothetical protein